MLYLEFGVIKELLLIKSIKNSEHVIDKLEKRSLYARKCFLLFRSPPVGQNKEDQRKLLLATTRGHTSGASHQ